MTRTEILFVYGPLAAVLIAAMIGELRTDLIYDVVTLPAFLYFSVVRGVLGPESWYSYAAAGLCAAILLGYLGSGLPTQLGKPVWLGMGAVKLTGAVTVALGLRASLYFVPVTLSVLVIGAFGVSRFLPRRILPSSPLIASTAIATLAWLPVAAS